MKRALGALALLTCACINLDQAYQVKDLRILAMRVDPPELLYSFLHLAPAAQRGGLPLGPYSVTAQVLAVDPQGRPVDVSMRLCPDNPDEGETCEGYVVRDTAPPEEVRAVVPLVYPTTSQRQADLSLGGELSVPSQGFTFTERALDYMLLHDADGNLSFNGVVFPSLPSIYVRMQVPGTDEVEVAFKRFALNLDIAPQGLSPEQRKPLEDLFTAFLGLGFCPEGTPDDADVQCVKRRVPNRNPHLARVLYYRGERLPEGVDPEDPEAGGAFQDFPGRLTVKAGEILRLRPLVPDHDRERYQAFNFNLDARKIELKNFTEDMAYSWYTTTGLIDAATSDQLFRFPDAYFQVSPDTPAGPSYVWVIVRDQRGGVDWRRLDLDVVVPDDAPGGLLGLGIGGL